MLVCKRKAGRDATKNYFQASFNHKSPIPEQQHRYEWIRWIEYMTTEHGVLFEMIMWLPLILMVLYIVLIEQGPLVISQV